MYYRIIKYSQSTVRKPTRFCKTLIRNSSEALPPITHIDFSFNRTPTMLVDQLVLGPSQNGRITEAAGIIILKVGLELDERSYMEPGLVKEVEEDLNREF